MIDTALEHIEKHKGRSVLYEMDKAAALDDLSAVLYKKGPLNITIKQLDNLFSDIWQNHQRHRTKKRRINHLLIEGRSSPDVYCDRSALLSRKDKLGLKAPLAEQLTTA